MSGELLYVVDQWLIYAVIIGLLILATEIGFYLGRRARANVDEPVRSQITTIQAAVLGLLALLLGFTFSMSMVRFDTRKQLVLAEANAIGTTFRPATAKTLRDRGL